MTPAFDGTGGRLVPDDVSYWFLYCGDGRPAYRPRYLPRCLNSCDSVTVGLLTER